MTLVLCTSHTRAHEEDAVEVDTTFLRFVMRGIDGTLIDLMTIYLARE